MKTGLISPMRRGRFVPVAIWGAVVSTAFGEGFCVFLNPSTARPGLGKLFWEVPYVKWVFLAVWVIMGPIGIADRLTDAGFSRWWSLPYFATLTAFGAWSQFALRMDEGATVALLLILQAPLLVLPTRRYRVEEGS